MTTVRGTCAVGATALSLALATVAAPVFAEKKPSLKGSWEMTGGRWTVDGKQYVAPGDATVRQIKVYSKHHFAFVGQYKLMDRTQDNYGGGSYKLKGTDYSETILYHTAAGAVGKTLHFKLELKGNTMTLTGPVGAEDQKALGNSFTEVYVRKD